MRAVLQRVSEASVTVNDKIVSHIGQGWLVLLGVAKGDCESQALWLAEKCVHLRGFNDESGKMNLSVLDTQGSILIVSQFTLLGDCRKGRRPGFDEAAPPELANELYECFCDEIARLGPTVQRGVFRADMKVRLVNDGPVTFIIDR